ncbi:ATP-binding cassette domain-containing protein, partial [Streptomyces canarius]
MEGMAIRLQGLRKSFGGTTAVDGVDLEIRDGEFFSMLGPSGSGKTTVLRLVAGFETPDEGRIELAGQEVTGLAPFERDVHKV